MITVQSVGKRYGELDAVSDLNFSIERGEIVGLLGQNGAGKTTCMKMITGYLEPTTGSIKINDIDMVEARTEGQRLIGYLPENAPLYPEMFVEEYLLFMAELRGIKSTDRAEAIDVALRSTGLIDRRRQLISTLSKGYKQRVGLAQAILHQPRILILDEPTNGLDPVQIQEIRELIKRLAQNTTILLSTHILSEIEAVCDRVLILIDGQLVSDQPLDELLNQSRVRLSVRKTSDEQKQEDLQSKLGALEGIKEIKLLSSDETGLHTYLVSYFEDQNDQPLSRLTPLLANEVMTNGWALGELSVHAQSLEAAFRELMRAHVASALREE